MEDAYARSVNEVKPFRIQLHEKYKLLSLLNFYLFCSRSAMHYSRQELNLFVVEISLLLFFPI